jgi:hypothetical protein
MITSSKYHGRESIANKMLHSTNLKDKVCIVCTESEIDILIFAMTTLKDPSKEQSDFLDDLIKFKNEAFGK